MRASQPWFGCCQVLYIYLIECMWVILWVFDICVSWFFSTYRGGILCFYMALIDCSCPASRTHVVMVIRGQRFIPQFLTFEWGVIFVFNFLLWQYLGIYHGNRWIVWCLMDLRGWVYGYLWGPLVYIVCHVLTGLCMCMCWGGTCVILSSKGLWCLGIGLLVADFH